MRQSLPVFSILLKDFGLKKLQYLAFDMTLFPDPILIDILEKGHVQECQLKGLKHLVKRMVSLKELNEVYEVEDRAGHIA